MHPGGIIGAASTFVSVVISLWTFATRPTRENAHTLPIRLYMSSLLITLFITLIAASLIWFSTLRERTLFTPVWSALPTPQKIYIQNDLQCCGWFNATLPGLFTDDLMSGFCEDPDIIKRDPDPNVTLGCVDKFDKKADDVLNNIFTLVGLTPLSSNFKPPTNHLYSLSLSPSLELRVHWHSIFSTHHGCCHCQLTNPTKAVS